MFAYDDMLKQIFHLPACSRASTSMVLCSAVLKNIYADQNFWKIKWIIYASAVIDLWYWWIVDPVESGYHSNIPVLLLFH